MHVPPYVCGALLSVLYQAGWLRRDVACMRANEGRREGVNGFCSVVVVGGEETWSGRAGQ